ncbi:putative Zn-dependent peptidase [Gelidibacter sediminis]|uniref:Putative Zn-dependent peptidase n=1 Tax=Gelidibacter sediminis TaxID=1608710 RepID=A0A4R7Q773_9FLAO|nr:pitrilysin family protein [Gelidibacter sediminis]TDU43374.1 putative Zn-dependent peptidase [Gelidibacter sediminis]
MKTYISAFLMLFLMAFSVHAQIDRSKQPQPGPAPKIDLKSPQEFTLKNGMKVLVVENHKLPRVSFSLTIDNKPETEGTKAGVSSLVGGMMGNGTTSISKEKFNEEIDFLGARLNFSSSGAYASALSQYADRILELMADATMHPLLVEDEFNKERDRLIEGLKSQEKSVEAVAGRVGNALSYGVKHPYGEFTTIETVNNIKFEDISAFYEESFNPNNAYLVVVGDVNFKKIKSQIEKRFGNWKKAVDVQSTVPNAIPNVQYTQINFVDMPNAVQSNILLTNNVNLKMNDPDYHAVLIANKILGGGFSSYLNMNLREKHAYTYGARSGVDADKYVGRFTASTAVRNMVTDSAVVQTLKEVNRIKSEPVSAEDLRNAKAKYVGDFVLALESPQTVARYALNIKLNNLPSDFYETFLQKINAVTAEDVTRVANTYFKPENARIVVVGKGSEVLENLEKTGIPILYFDAFANPVEKPKFSKPIPDGVTASTVIDAYFNAVGGKEKAKAVKSIWTTANVTIEDAPFSPIGEMKTMIPNKTSLEMSIEGMGVIMKQKFNGTTGYTEQQGVKRDLTEEQINDQKASHTIFPELYFEPSTLSLESMISINGSDAYKIKVSENGKDSFRYYDAKSGYLVRVEKTTEVQGQTFTTVEDFGNYSPVKDMMYPYSISVSTGPQVVKMNVTNHRVNEGVTEADFN